MTMAPKMIRKKFVFTILIACSVILTIYYLDLVRNSFAVYNFEVPPEIKNPKYLVSSSKCKILDLEPFNDESKWLSNMKTYVPCRTSELLTYVTKIDNRNILHVRHKDVSCCYSNITRNTATSNPDDNIRVSDCIKFTNNVTVHEDVIYVKCDSSPAYENVHATIQTKDDVQKKIETFDSNSKPLSVLIVGIDSLSRLNFIRNLPNTHAYVTDNDWVALKGYNKVGLNTFPNLMALLTGYNESYAKYKCRPEELGGLDQCPMLWYDFRKSGYITGFAEDEESVNTFNNFRKGFLNAPVDYYFRPYSVAFERLLKLRIIDDMKYCTGPENSGERILNVAKEFSITFKDYPQFGLFWMNSFSHNKLNAPSRLDNKIKQFLYDLKTSGVLDNVIVMFLSDHGIRFGKIITTFTGWLEERLPFIYVSFPQWFKEKYTHEYNNFLANKDKLTSTFDLHMMLQHILVLSGSNYTVKPSDGCPTCRSLFEKVDQDRSCEQAGITQNWCTCTGYKDINVTNQVAERIADFVINKIQDIIHNHNGDDTCTKFVMNKLISLRETDKMWYKNETYILIRFETHPKAIFESTLKYKGVIEDSNFQLAGTIGRLDLYGPHSQCVNDGELKQYCYCR